MFRYFMQLQYIIDTSESVRQNTFFERAVFQAATATQLEMVQRNLFFGVCFVLIKKLKMKFP